MWNRQPKPSAFKSTDSLIGQGGTLEGKVHCDTNLRIEGNFSGEIHCSGTVTVGEQGTVRSSINAQEIIIAGKVFGDATAARKLVMTGTGQLHGNISAGTLHIMEGSVLSGSVMMSEAPASEALSGRDAAAPSADKGKTRSSKKQDAREAG